jgi:hypothetical protein
VATSTEGVAFQANWKTPAGTLLNVYAPDAIAFDNALNTFPEFVAKIAAIESALQGASVVAQSVPLAPAYQQPPTAPAPQPTPGADAVHLCDHGQPMKLIPAGISKASGKPYKAFWACTQPRGMQCDAKVTV